MAVIILKLFLMLPNLLDWDPSIKLKNLDFTKDKTEGKISFNPMMTYFQIYFFRMSVSRGTSPINTISPNRTNTVSVSSHASNISSVTSQISNTNLLHQPTPHLHQHQQLHHHPRLPSPSPTPYYQTRARVGMIHITFQL